MLTPPRFQASTVSTPASVVILFVILLLCSIWSFCILIAVLRANNTALWIAFWDIVCMGALIAGVAVTSNLANYECGTVVRTYYYTADGRRLSDPFVSDQAVQRQQFWDHPGNCNLLKAAWGLAIANIIMFFITALLAISIYKQNEEEMRLERPRSAIVQEKVYMEYPDRPRRAHRSRHASRSDRRRGEGIYGDRFSEY
jgi:hypothetical protein